MIDRPMADATILRTVVRFMVPFIQLFGLYTYAHGESSPGGGFQGGVIIAASFVLLALVNGWRYGRDAAPESTSDLLAPAGVLVYGLTGFGALLFGGAFLEYAAYVDQTDPHAVHLAHHLGLVSIELGVTLTVSAAMVTLYFEMARPDDAPAASPPPGGGPADV